MTSRYWTGKTGNSNWTQANNWNTAADGSGSTGVPAAGDDVILTSMGAAYAVTLSSATGVLSSLSIGDGNYSNPYTNSVVLQLNAGGSLSTSGAINIANFGTLEGAGTVSAGDGFGIIYRGTGTRRSLLAQRLRAARST